MYVGMCWRFVKGMIVSLCIHNTYTHTHTESINICIYIHTCMHVCLLLKTKTNQHTLYIDMFQSLLLCNLETTCFFFWKICSIPPHGQMLVCGLIHEGGLAWTSMVNSKQSIKSTHTHIFAWCVFFPNWKCTSYFGNLSRICLCFWGSLSESKLISTHLSHDIICTHKQYTYIYICIYFLVVISSPESRGLAPQKPSILESPPAPLLCYKIKDHGLASTQKQPIFDMFGLYLGRFLILQMGAPTVSRKCTKPYNFVMELIL